MKKRTLIIRVGDHWFLRYFRDLYETLASKYTTSDQPRGILSIFPDEMPSPFWFRKKTLDGGLAFYYKDTKSVRAFSEKLENDTQLKIYIAAHSAIGSENFYSLEPGKPFALPAEAIAGILFQKLKDLDVKPSAINPIKISLIACYAAQGRDGLGDSLAVKLLEELHKLGLNHILVKAREKSVSAPIFGIKSTSGKKEHFYLADHTIYHTEKEHDLRRQVLKVIKHCYEKTGVAEKKVYLASCLQAIDSMGYTSEKEQIAQLKRIVDDARQNVAVKQYKDGTGWFMRFFNIQSNTEKSLNQLNECLSTASNEGYDVVEHLPASVI